MGCSGLALSFVVLFFSSIACAEDPRLIPSTDIQFILEETYRVGETIEVKIRNAGKAVYFYNEAYAACDLSYFNSMGRQFIIPPGTHCDQVVYVEINPGETKTLFRWDLSECIEDQWGCVKNQPLSEGIYTIKGKFSRSDEEEKETREAVAVIKIIK